MEQPGTAPNINCHLPTTFEVNFPTVFDVLPRSKAWRFLECENGHRWMSQSKRLLSIVSGPCSHSCTEAGSPGGGEPLPSEAQNSDSRWSGELEAAYKLLFQCNFG